MDTIDLDLERKEAGAEYLVALGRLGLDPNALFWAYDHEEDRFVLVLATDMFDLKGPLAVSQLLFKAYNASATPKTIDPFVVRLHSPDHFVIRQLDGWKITGPDGRGLYGLDERLQKAPFATISTDSTGLEFRSSWVYRYDLPQRARSVDVIRRWNRFSRNVDRLAA